MPPARFGASKFRNAVPHIPSRDEWYRGGLPPTSASNSTASTTSTFSSELKANREWIVTLSPAGGLSYRGYEEVGKDGQVGVVNGLGGGGGVGDWDLSRLEDGMLVIGGLDGTISFHRLPSLSASPAQPTALHVIPASSSPITTLSLHPTTPDLLLTSSIDQPVAIYDVSTSPTAPVIELSASETKGMWSVAWSADGKLVAGVGKSGSGSVWDPRAGKHVVMSKSLSLQPLKPARIAFVGDDIFLTSFSKTRNREYSLLSPKSSLSSTFTQSVDTNTSPLVFDVDQERRIVYTAGRGDMTLRQVELSGATGFQETLHPLPHALASASIALAHPATLEVMAAQIGTVLLPVVDKDGDTIMPFGVRVPRRQLIDFHEDLYPLVSSTVPEQTAQEWLTGGDMAPLPISLDPAKRSSWESTLKEASAKSAMPVKAVTEPASEATPKAPVVSAPEPPPEPDSAPLPTEKTTSGETLPTVSSSTGTDDLPPLADGETHASTSYKVRLIAHHIGEQLDDHRISGSKTPLMVGLQGPQGCGKTTLCESLVKYLNEKECKLKVAILSLDDLYKDHAGLKAVAERHADNDLLSGRGPPGTHDSELASSVLSSVKAINEEQEGASTQPRVVSLPVFDKSLCDGEGDRSPDTIKIEGPIDVFILEGWSMGFAPLSKKYLSERYDEAAKSGEKSHFSAHPLASLLTINDYLAEFASRVYPFFSTIVQIEPTSYENVFAWRLEQEHAMKSQNGGRGMTDEQVHGFVERYMPGYELWREGIWADNAPWAGRVLRLFFGGGREVIRITRPTQLSNTEDALASSSSTPAAPGPSTDSAGEKSRVEATPSSTQALRSSDLTHAPKSSSKTTGGPSSLPKSTTPYNPTWSRKFLAGKCPLNPTYDQIPSLATLHQDSLVTKCTPHLAFFPIQGPGGRLGVHPLKKKGRMALGGEGYLSGGTDLVDFAVEAFSGQDGARVALAGEDGVVRIWRLGEEGVQGPGSEPDLILKGKGLDKIAQLAFHPTAKDLLSAATNDFGKSSIRFWDLSSGEEIEKVAIEASGVFNVAWAPNGDRVAIATKDGHALVLDPRKPTSVASGKAHDSPRSFQMTWIGDSHLLSVGFSRGSQRKINLYALRSDSSGEIETVHSLLIDVSPSVLFPVYDPDTSILYVWGKGERQIQAYEVHPENKAEPIVKLPSYTGGSPQVAVAFLPKRVVDVRKVEVAKTLRLTAKSIEEVAYSIPRNKPEFFQDDIYLDTIDVETPSTSAADWWKGDNSPPHRISLKPEGMMPLSQAPQTTSAAKAKFVPAANVMSEEEEKRREMDRLFQKAKMDESDEEEQVKTGIDPPDDDW